MNRDLFLNLAREGHCLPIGTHLVLHEQPDPDAILLDGERLGAVVIEAARRFRTPLAMPLMDLTVEKEALLIACGVPPDEIGTFHFTAAPDPPAGVTLTPRMRATCDALTSVAGLPDLLSIGMSIGPYSLLTKLVRDPITPVYLSGMGRSPEDEPEIALLNTLLGMGEAVIHRYVEAQIEAGAQAIVICEPAANLVYFSPLQMAENSKPFETYVMEPMRRVAALLAAHKVDLIVHDCGELTDEMVRRLGSLGATMMSLGSSRELVHDAGLVPPDVVLYGNLPSKSFFESQLTPDEVEQRGKELVERMAAVGHPFILGTECDVLSVPGRESEISSKVHALMQCCCERGEGGRRSPRCRSFCASTSGTILQ